MVSVRDVRRVTAELLRQTLHGTRMTGPATVSPTQIAGSFAAALGRPVEVSKVPKDAWDMRFRAKGMRHPEARMAMLDGFTEGWLGFEGAFVEQQLARPAWLASALVASA